MNCFILAPVLKSFLVQMGQLTKLYAGDARLKGYRWPIRPAKAESSMSYA